MHHTTLILSLAALTSVAVSTKHKDHGPRCPEDDYYNTMMESKNRKAAATDCSKWLGGTITDPQEIPKYLDDCGTDKNEDRVSRVSAACSCVATSVPTAFTTSIHVSSTPSSTAILTSSSSAVSLPDSTNLPHPSTPSSSLPSPTTTSSHEAPPAASSPAHNHETMSTSSTETPNTVSNSMHTTTVITKPGHPTSTLPLHFATTQASSELVTDSSHTSATPSPENPEGSADSTATSFTPSPAPTTSFTTSTIYTESIYTVTSCAPGKPDCPAASTVLVTSTIALATTICPVTETPRPSPPHEQPPPAWTTSTIYSTSMYTLTRCPPGAVNCPVSNLPITTAIPVSTTVLPGLDNTSVPGVETAGGNDTQHEGSDNKQGGTPTQSAGPDGDHGNPGAVSTTLTVVTVPTTITTIMNGVTAQILTVVPVTSAVTLSTGAGAASPTDASPFGASAWQPAEASRSGLTSKPPVPPPANGTAFAGSGSPRPHAVVTAGAPGLVAGNGMRAALFILVLAVLF